MSLIAPARLWLLLFTGVSALSAHAPLTPSAQPPLRVDARNIVDATGLPFVVRGVVMPGLEVAEPSPADLEARRVMTGFTFRILRQRWNLNAVTLPVSVWLWKRDGDQYLDRVAAAVALANQESLLVILTACGDARCGNPDDTGLPGTETLDFWRAAALRLRETPGVIFSLYLEPSTRSIPGNVVGVRRAADWQIWRNGGTLQQSRTAVGMQALVDGIRSAGAKQVIAAPSFQDALEFQGFDRSTYLNDPNIVYEVHPYFDLALTDEARDRNFGFLLDNFPVLAGAWGATFGANEPSCAALPGDTVQATTILFQTVAYFDLHSISYSVGGFAPGNLIHNFDDYAPTVLGNRWDCSVSDGRTGIGQFLLLWITGDANGFGSLDRTMIVSAAGGFAAPIAPGQIISLYGQLVGPEVPIGPQLVDGKLATSVGDVQVLFDGVAAPILTAGYFLVDVQVPYELAGREKTVLQLVYRGIPSNPVELLLVAAAPGIFTNFVGSSEAKMLNQDGSLNTPENPAPRGSVVSLFATGTGTTAPFSITGEPAAFPLPASGLPLTLSIGGRPADVLYAGPAPGLVGITQINAIVPPGLPVTSPTRAAVTLSAGNLSSGSGVVFWVK